MSLPDPTDDPGTAAPFSRRELGLKLRMCRRAAGKTLKEIARESGLSVGFISQVERGLSSPSLSSLVSIAKALGVGVSQFVEQPGPKSAVSRHQDRKPYSIGEGAVVYERLSHSFGGNLLKATLIHVPPFYLSEGGSHEGEEFMYVLEGHMRYWLDGAYHDVYAGDSIHFASSTPHQLENPGPDKVHILWVGSFDIFSENR